MSIHTLASQYVQLYAKLKETDENGYGYCKTCGKMVSWDESDGGHCIPKGISCNQASIDPRNVHLQCRPCNSSPDIASFPAGFLPAIVLSVAGAQVENPSWGNVESFNVDARYREFIEKTYSPAVYEEFKLLAKKPLDRSIAHAAVEMWKEICKKLAKKKNFKVNMP
jgi:hypothetical protein